MTLDLLAEAMHCENPLAQWKAIACNVGSR